MADPVDLNALRLETRSGLPDALRVLVEEFPKDAWEAHPEFGGLVQFWLSRHVMFRRLLGLLIEQSEARLDGTVDDRTFRTNLSRLGSTFVGELHNHHNVEDMHYFPKLAQRDARIASGFALLDADHHAIDPLLNRYAEKANAVLNAPESASDLVVTLLDETRGLGRLLHRHLEDEEDLVVPVVLKFGQEGLG